MKKISMLFSFLFLVVLSSELAAQNTELMLFQAEIADQSLQLLDGSDTYNITFSIWNAITGGTVQWEQTITGMVFRKGTISALLGGTASPFPTGLFNTENLYIQITLTKGGVSETLSPRMKISSSAYMIAGVETTGCDTGMTRVSSFCIDINRSGPISEAAALKACYDRGMELCEWWQSMHACDLKLLDVNNGTALAGEWTQTAGGQNIKGLWGESNTDNASLPYCGKLETPSSIWGTTIYTHYYRCCK